MLMFRALNEFDILCNPLQNGLPSKKLIYDLTKSYIEANEFEFLKKLNNSEQDKYIKDNMTKYIMSHQNKLKKMFKKRSCKIPENLRGIYFNINHFNPETFNESWAYLSFYLSSLNNHLCNGSKTYTDWISTSKNLNNIGKFYKKQNIHKVAVLKSTSKGLADENTLVIDLSSRELIDEILPFISKKISTNEFKKFINNSKEKDVHKFIVDEDFFNPTSKKFMGFNYSISDNEVCIYKYMPKENVVSVLEALQIDLISLKLFNINEFCKLEKSEQINELKKLKQKIRKKIELTNDSELKYTFNEVYIENKNISTITNNIFEQDKLNKNRVKILKIAKNIPNIQIKKDN